MTRTQPVGMFPVEQNGQHVIHEITQWRAPNGHTLRCTCGWSHFVPRQNALARAAKVKAAIRKHYENADD